MAKKMKKSANIVVGEVSDEVIRALEAAGHTVTKLPELSQADFVVGGPTFWRIPEGMEKIVVALILDAAKGTAKKKEVLLDDAE